MSKSPQPPSGTSDEYFRSERRAKRLVFLFCTGAIAAPIWMFLAWFTTAGKSPFQIMIDWWTPSHWWELVLKILFTIWAFLGWIAIVANVGGWFVTRSG
jgi:hypothetical protein